MIRIIVILLGVIGLFTSAGAGEEGTRERIEADIRFLADDLLDGRGTPGRGLDTAALFLAESLRGAGWQPGVGESFMQEYGVREYRLPEADISVTLNGFELGEDEFVINSWSTGPYNTPMTSPLVFAGQGVVDVTKGMNPYEDMDLRDKAVVTILGAPWELDPNTPFGYDRAAGKSIEIMIRNADLLVYVTEEIATHGDAPSSEVGFFR